MFEWKVEDMKLMNEKCNTYYGNEKIYNCEHEVSKEDKIKFVDSLTKGNLSYLLDLQEKFNKEKDTLKQDDFGRVKTVSLKAWLKKNDTKCLVDAKYEYGKYSICRVERNILCPKIRKSYDTYEELIDECFHRQLKACEQLEKNYFKTHDEYSILKEELKKYMEKYKTTFNVNISIWSTAEICIFKDTDTDVEREITKEELTELISKYKQLDELTEKLTKETNIVY